MPILVGVAVFILSMHEARLIKLTLPHRKRQVPATWRVTMNPLASSSMYGFALGSGMTTVINSAAYYILILAVIMSGVFGGVTLGVMILSLYGTLRAAPAILAGLFVKDSGASLTVVLNQYERLAWQLSAMTLSVVAGMITCA